MRARTWFFGIGLGAANFALAYWGARWGDSTQTSIRGPSPLPLSSAVPSLSPIVARDLKQADLPVAISTRRRTHKQPTRETASAALATTRHSDPEVSAMATMAVATAYQAGLIDTADLVRRIEEAASQPEKTQYGLYRALASRPSEEATSMFAALAKNGTVGLRRSAVLWLAGCDRHVAIPVLLSALRDSDEYVRDQARQSLITLEDAPDLGLDPATWQRWLED